MKKGIIFSRYWFKSVIRNSRHLSLCNLHKQISHKLKFTDILSQDHFHNKPLSHIILFCTISRKPTICWHWITISRLILIFTTKPTYITRILIFTTKPTYITRKYEKPLYLQLYSPLSNKTLIDWHF